MSQLVTGWFVILTYWDKFTWLVCHKCYIVGFESTLISAPGSTCFEANCDWHVCCFDAGYCMWGDFVSVDGMILVQMIIKRSLVFLMLMIFTKASVQIWSLLLSLWSECSSSCNGVHDLLWLLWELDVLSYAVKDARDKTRQKATVKNVPPGKIEDKNFLIINATKSPSCLREAMAFQTQNLLSMRNGSKGRKLA